MSHNSYTNVNFSNNNQFDDIEELIESTDATIEI
jgi:hypothetical protein